jgi:hypothetical protein
MCPQTPNSHGDGGWMDSGLLPLPRPATATNGEQPPPKTERLLSEAKTPRGHHEQHIYARRYQNGILGRNYVPFSFVQKQPEWFMFPSARFRGDDPDLEMQPGRTMPHVLCRTIYLWHGSLLPATSHRLGTSFPGNPMEEVLIS